MDTRDLEFIGTVIRDLQETLEKRKKEGSSSTSYVASLLSDEDKVLQKLSEETAELLLAVKGKSGEKNVKDIIHEAADLWFHLQVLLLQVGITPEDVFTEIQRRSGVSGIAEKRSRSQL